MDKRWQLLILQYRTVSTVRAELVEAGAGPLARQSVPHARAGGGGRDFAPAGEVLVLCFAKEKYPKERRPYRLRPSASLRATCGARGRGALRNSLCAARAARTTAASQFTKPVCPAAHRPPRPLRSSAHPEGNPGSPSGPSLRSAPNAQRVALAPAKARPSAAMARVAVRLSHPCWLRLRRGGCGVTRASKRPCFVV